MADARGKAAFAEKPLTHLRRIEPVPEYFQGDAACRSDLLGIVNRTHTAAAKQSTQSVIADARSSGVALGTSRSHLFSRARHHCRPRHVPVLARITTIEPADELAQRLRCLGAAHLTQRLQRNGYPR